MSHVDGQQSFLLVGGDAASRQDLRQHLDIYDVVECDTAAEAWRHLAPTLTAVLLDADIPDMTCVSFCHRVRQQPNLITLPLILTADATETQLIIDTLEAGCSDFLSTPIHPAELNARLNLTLKRRQLREGRDLLISELRERSERDPLTHLYNRHVLRTYAGREIAKAQRTGQPLSLLMIDLDNLKALNDTYGHPAADTILVQLAQLLLHQLRHYDLLTRHGGDEFVVLLPNTPLAAAYRVANKLRESVNGHAFPSDQGDITVTVSIGVAEWQGDDTTSPQPKAVLKQLLTAADANLYEAKARGRNRVVVSEGPPSQQDCQFETGVSP